MIFWYRYLYFNIEWVEFSPYEVSIPKYGAAINMKHFGSKFIKGVLTEKKMELPLYEIMGKFKIK